MLIIIELEGIFIVFMVYTAIGLVCLVFIAIITIIQKGKLSKAEVLVIE